ncbi:MAG TPA: hypothetical protein V6D22_20805, partial [Candidatus Obscuribacterales bacterium]
MTQKTYWHLEHERRIPTEYELASSKLLYYKTHRGFELTMPLDQWYEQHQLNSELQCQQWDRFSDPRATTYTSYTEMQSDKETFVDALLELMGSSDYDAGLNAAHVELLEKVIAPMRYPVHGLQMVASYFAHMAPEGRITIASMFQSLDEVRRIQRLAYRTRLLQLTHPKFAHNSQSVWENDPMWQPLREIIERLLVVYDWGQSFVVCNLVVKPLFDELMMVHFGHLAKCNGDYLLDQMLGSLHQDCLWQRQWSQALVNVVLRSESGLPPAGTEERRRLACGDGSTSTETIMKWIHQWYPQTLRAMHSFGSLFERHGGAAIN